MKKQLKIFYGKIIQWPVIGHAARVCVAFLKLPGFHAVCLDQLNTISTKLNRSEHMITSLKYENFLISLPATLREMKQDLASIRAQLDALSTKKNKKSD